MISQELAASRFQWPVEPAPFLFDFITRAPGNRHGRLLNSCRNDDF